MPNADLDLYVRTDFHDGRTRLTYILHSPSGKADLTFRQISGPILHASLEGYQAHLIEKINKLGEGYHIDGSYLLDTEIERKLANLGQDLYRELFPPEMRQAYWKMRHQGVEAIRIISDEPWIPWELIKPFDDSQPKEIVNDEFLCVQFELTRWLAGDRTPQPEIRVKRLACIVTNGNLPMAEEEKDFLAALAKAFGIEDASPSLSTASEAESFLKRGGIDLLHFTGHGTFDVFHPNESGLQFADGSVLRPEDLQIPLSAKISQEHPLVFLNACSTGQQGWSLTGLGGWADRWVRICGCGAFVAPMWPVRDSLALEFIKTFYGSLFEGSTFGQAARLARQHIRKLKPQDPSWLAYSVYADVHGRLTLGDSWQSLQGNFGASPEWGSAWIDLSLPTDFRKGDSLRLTLDGSAIRMLVRFLPLGVDPNQAVGILAGKPFEIPENKTVTLTLEEDHQRITQISVHGGPNPWGSFTLGAGNGPVTLRKVERLTS